MRNYIAPGQSVDLVAAAAYTAGIGYVVGSIFGVAANTAAIGSVVTLHLTGIYEFDGEGSVGDAAYWDNTAKTLTGTARDGLYKVGSIVGVNGDKRQVRLDGIAVSAADVADPAVLTTPTFAYTQGDMDDGGKFTVGVAVDGGAQSVDVPVADAETFDIDDFVAGLNAGLVGASAAKSADGTKVVLTTDAVGTIATIEITSLIATTSAAAVSSASVGFNIVAEESGTDAP